MKVTWLGQAGLLLKTEGVTIIVDPYLSYAVDKINEKMVRRYAPNEEYLNLTPDVILLTHDHIDHTDPETLKYYLKDGEVTVLASRSAYGIAKAFGGEHNYVMMTPHSVWSTGGVTIYSVRAAHSDEGAVGFIIDDGEVTYYISGDTVYNFEVIDDVLDLVEDGVDFAFLPINGRGCNMNARDAADFAYEIGAKAAIPLHYGLYDEVDPDNFDFDDRRILPLFEEVEL